MRRNGLHVRRVRSDEHLQRESHGISHHATAERPHQNPGGSGSPELNDCPRASSNESSDNFGGISLLAIITKYAISIRE